MEEHCYILLPRLNSEILLKIVRVGGLYVFNLPRWFLWAARVEKHRPQPIRASSVLKCFPLPLENRLLTWLWASFLTLKYSTWNCHFSEVSILSFKSMTGPFVTFSQAEILFQKYLSCRDLNRTNKLKQFNCVVKLMTYTRDEIFV